jgi:hypothetical protein
MNERQTQDRARHQEIRERFQSERPALEQLVASGEYNAPLPMGEHLSIRQAALALHNPNPTGDL